MRATKGRRAAFAPTGRESESERRCQEAVRKWICRVSELAENGEERGWLAISHRPVIIHFMNSQKASKRNEQDLVRECLAEHLPDVWHIVEQGAQAGEQAHLADEQPVKLSQETISSGQIAGPDKIAGTSVGGWRQFWPVRLIAVLFHRLVFGGKGASNSSPDRRLRRAFHPLRHLVQHVAQRLLVELRCGRHSLVGLRTARFPSSGFGRSGNLILRLNRLFH